MSDAFLIPEHAPLRRHKLGALTSIGRHPENSISIQDRSVSKFHAQVHRTEDGGYELQDLGSRNGTFVGGERIQRCSIGNGDEVVLGTVRFRFRAERGEVAITSSTSEVGVLRRGGVTMIGPTPGSTPSGVALVASEPAIEVADSLTIAQDRFLPGDEVVSVDELRRDYDKLRIAHELSSVFRMDSDLDDLLKAIATRSFDLIPADRCAILLMAPDGETLESRIVMERGGGEPKETMRLSQTVLDEVIANRKAILCTDAISDGRFQSAASIVALSIRSAMCVPLIHEDELFGAMHVDSLHQVQAFSQKDLQIFTSVANQAGFALKNASLVQQIQKESETRARLGRLLSPNLVEDVVNGKLDIAQGGEARDVAVMFTDIRGFTRMSESMAASDVTRMLNEYFEVMVEILFQWGGTLDKYIGDAMMALFGVPRADDGGTLRAVRCALAMQGGLRSLNRTREARGDEPLGIGIGINFGEVIWGPMGSRQTTDYTVVGDVVNTASRLCSLSPAGDVIISERVLKLVEGSVKVEELPPTKLKGKAAPIQVYRVISAGELSPPESS
ncbi:MAG: adenylate cyclase [Deltaproteobacteria bacterium]|nr:adenylate cyclase [Deltaproteobacteria bacterium]